MHPIFFLSLRLLFDAPHCSITFYLQKEEKRKSKADEIIKEQTDKKGLIIKSNWPESVVPLSANHKIALGSQRGIESVCKNVKCTKATILHKLSNQRICQKNKLPISKFQTKYKVQKAN